MERLQIFFILFIVFNCFCFCKFHQNIIKVYNETNLPQTDNKKDKFFYDYLTRVRAYKDLREPKCILEFLKKGDKPKAYFDSQNYQRIKVEKFPKLSLNQIWTIAGPRIMEFCRGFPTYLLQDETDTNQVKHIQKRETKHYFVGRVRGQTQSQYLNHGNNNNSGKAEAEATYGGSKAIVSGTSGAGQAQSQSSPYGCDDCYDQHQVLQYGPSGEPFKRPGQIHQDSISGQIAYQPGTTTHERPTGIQGRPGAEGTVYPLPPGMGRPSNKGERPFAVPGKTSFGETTFNENVPGLPLGEAAYPRARPGEISYPGKIPDEASYPGSRTGLTGYPVSRPVETVYSGNKPEATYPGARPGEIAYTGARPDGTVYPGERPGAATYPGSKPGEIAYTGARPDGTVYPGERPGAATYPGSKPGEIAYTGARLDGTVYPGERPGAATYPGSKPGEIAYTGARPGDTVYPGENSGAATYPGARPGEIAYTGARPDDTVYPGERPGAATYPSSKPGGIAYTGARLDGTVYPGERPGVATYTGSKPGEISYTGARPGDTIYHGKRPGAAPGEIAYPAIRPEDTAYTEAIPGKYHYPGVRPGETLYPGSREIIRRPADGHVTAQYGLERGQQGKFYGTFSGQYDVDGGSYPGSRTVQAAYPGLGVPDRVSYQPAPDAQQGSTGPNIYPTRPKQTTEIISGPGRPSTAQYPIGPDVEATRVGQLDSRIQEEYGTQTGQAGQFAGTFSGQYSSQQNGGVNSLGHPDLSVPSYPGVTDQFGRPLLTNNRSPHLGGVRYPSEASAYPGGVAPQVNGYPERAVPGRIGGPRYPGSAEPSTRYTGATPPGSQALVPGTDNFEARGRVETSYPGARGPESVSYPGARGPGESMYPGTGSLGATRFPGSREQVARYPGPIGTDVTGTGVGKIAYPGSTQNGFGGYPTTGTHSVGSGYPYREDSEIGTAGRYPDGRPLPGAVTRPGQYINGQEADDADSQAQTAIQQQDNGTQASATAQGKYHGGTSQSQVLGAYSGSGSFSASAGSDDGERGAQTQVNGGKEGAQSTAQGKGGMGQSQAQIQVFADTGETLSSSQTRGLNHGTQTQVQASGKGGMADAQSNGQGSTSSQAQIGFIPDVENENSRNTPFMGGGMASAQSGTHSGQSQSQINGKFSYGIKYAGAAQAGSGAKSNQSKIDLSNDFPQFKPMKLSEEMVTSHSKKHFSVNSMQTPSPITKSESKSRSRQEETDDYNEEYDEGDYDETPEQAESQTPLHQYVDHAELQAPKGSTIMTSNPSQPEVIEQKSKGQTQQIVIDPVENLDVTVTRSQDGFPEDGTILQPGETIPGTGFKIPAGFRGRVKSISNGHGAYTSGKHSQAQSVKINPGSGRVIYRPPIYTVSTKTLRNGYIGYGSGYTYQPHRQTFQVKNGKSLPNFMSVSKSETGSANPITGKKTPTVIYTQASSCGVFTNTCVFNSTGKICVPVPKKNPDGSLVTC